MMPPRYAPRPTRPVAVTAALLVLTLMALGAPAPAAAVCNVTSACSATAFLASAQCCTATSCAIDVNVTVPGPTCTWDFGSRNVTLSRTTTLGAANLNIATTGMVMVAGSAKVVATTGAFSIGAESSVTLASGTELAASAGGDIEIIGSNVTALGRIHSDGGGGNIFIQALSGSIIIDRPSTEGLSAFDGSVTLLTDDTVPGGNITINTPMSVEGGDVDVDAGGKIEVQRLMQVGNHVDGGGGITLTSTFNDVVISGQGRLDGSAVDQGGSVSIDAARDIVVGNNIDMRGKSNGFGGEVSTSAVRDTLFQGSAQIDVSGTGSGIDAGDGGYIDVASGRDVSLATNVRFFGNAGGSGTNGGAGAEITVDAGSTLLGLGAVPGALTINGRIVAQGHSNSGNSISLGGCQVTIASGAQVDATGDVHSGNLIVARKGLTIAGQLRATESNVIELPVGGTFTTTGGTISPASTPSTCVGGTPSATVCRRPVCTIGSPLGCLTPCPTCGDGNIDFPEECDGGPSNSRCATGCTESCQLDSCDDGNTCTTDACDPIGGCYFAGFVPDGTVCDNATVCDGREECRLGACKVIMGSVPSCGDDNNPCTIESCDPVSGCQTTNAPNGPTTACADPTECCTDLNLCDGTETCATGACVAGAPKTCEIEGDVCTPATGTCAPPSPCMDDAECDDNNPCTVDDCDAGGHCSNMSQTGPGVTGCDDGNACNGVEECVASECVPSAPPVCDDGDPCTSETCLAATGCTTPAPIANCCEATEECPDDGNACTTVSACVDRRCTTPTPVPLCCNDNAECDDGNTCTPGGTCQAHECVAVPPPDCTDDGNLCTDDFCDPVAGCVHAQIPGCCSSNTDCDDGTACTTDTCDPVFHTCSNVQEDGDCVACDESDVFSCDGMGLCANTTCVAGTCVPQTPPNCDDEDDCTDDSCKPADGCQNVLRTEDPQCTNVDCTADTECADTDLCTVDTCEAKGSTCRHTAAVDLAAVTCRLDGIDAILAGAGDDLITKPGRKKVVAKLNAVRNKKLKKAESLIAKGKTKPAAKQYKAAANLLNALAKLVNKKSGKFYDASVAVDIARLATEAKAAVESVRAGLLAN